MTDTNRLLVFDLDGTLLNDAHEILEASVDALWEAAEAGHMVVLASARPPRSVKEIAGRLRRPPTAYIALNGAYNERDGQVTSEHPLDRAAARQLIGIGRRHALHINVYAGQRWFVEAETEASRKEAAAVGFDPEQVDDLTGVVDPIHKILFIGEPDTVLQAQDDIAGASVPVTAALSQPRYLDIVADSVGKAEAVRAVAADLGYDMASVVAFGDNDNDAEMLRAAGIGIAMANARKAAKKAADWVTGDHNEDGIAAALQKLGI